MVISLEKRLETVIDEAIELADLGGRRVPAAKIAKRIVESEPELVRELAAVLALERFTWLIIRRRRAYRSELDSDQMLLADPIFQDLPKRIFVRSGQRPRMAYAVLADNKFRLAALRDRGKQSYEVRQQEAVVELHAKWDQRVPRIEWGDVLKREAKEREGK